MKNIYVVFLLSLVVFFGACSNAATTAVIKLPTDPIVTRVTVTADGNVTQVTQGGTVQFSAAVDGLNNPLDTVAWSIVEQDVKDDTVIHPVEGLLTIALNEVPLKTITVKATSFADYTMYGTAQITVQPDPYLGTIFSPSDSSYMLRANGAIGTDFQNQLASGKWFNLNENDTYILSANVYDLDPDDPDTQGILRFRLFNSSNNIYWVNGIFIDTPDKWNTIDADQTRPAFTEDPENVITPLSGDFTGWYNVQMKFKVPSVGSSICGWGWSDAWVIQPDYTVTSLATGDTVTASGSDPATIKSSLKSWQLQLHIKVTDHPGKSYLIDNIFLYPEGGSEKDSICPPFNEWNATPYNSDLGPEGSIWTLLPTMNQYEDQE